MFRAVPLIAAAIALVQPSMPKSTRMTYASWIRDASGCSTKRCEIDPLTLVAFFWHESGFSPTKVGDSGRAIGLGQSWSWLYTKECQRSRTSAACAKRREALFDPHYNIHVTAAAVRKARETCRQKTGRSALFHRWLSLMGGRNHPRKAFKGIWCAQRKVKGRWRDVAWRREPRFRAIREIISCRRNLTRKHSCRRAGRSARASSRSMRRR